MKQVKDIKYYLSLPYKIEIEPISEKEGGGYTARLSQFGSMGIVGDGETIQEAIEDLENYKKLVFESLIKSGKKIPDPENEITQYSGKVLIRMPKELHSKLIEDARINGVSLNQYMVYLLSSNRMDLSIRDLVKAIETKIETCVSNIPEIIYDKSKLVLEPATSKKSNIACRINEFKCAA